MAKVVHIRQLILAFSKHVYTIYFPENHVIKQCEKICDSERSDLRARKIPFLI